MGLWVRRGLIHRPRRPADSSGQFGIVERLPAPVVARQAARAVEDCEVAVGVFVDPDLGLDVMGPRGARRDLRGKAMVADRVVIADDAVLADAKDVTIGLQAVRNEGRSGRLRGHREAAVVIGQVHLGDEAVGGLDRGDAGERELLDQAGVPRPPDRKSRVFGNLWRHFNHIF